MSSIVLKLWFTVKERFRNVSSPNPVFIIIDEFQNVQQLKILETILSEARKFGLHLILSHQNLSQIRIKLLETILGNTAVQVFFRLSGRDSKKMALEIDWSISEELLRVLPQLGVGEAIIKIAGNNGLNAPYLIKTRVFEGSVIEREVNFALLKTKFYIAISQSIKGSIQKKVLMEIFKTGDQGASIKELLINTGLNQHDLYTILEYLKSRGFIKEVSSNGSNRYFLSENILKYTLLSSLNDFG